MRTKRVATVLMAGCAAVVTWAVPGHAQRPQEHQHAATAKAKPASATAKAKPASATAAKPPSDMAARCQAMMAEREQMMTGMKAGDQKLDDLVAKMNAASGTEKTDAAAAVVTEMVAQHRAMRDGRAKAQQKMMGHMMEHMEAGKDSMAKCPMMKQKGEMKH